MIIAYLNNIKLKKLYKLFNKCVKDKRNVI